MQSLASWLTCHLQRRYSCGPGTAAPVPEMIQCDEPSAAPRKDPCGKMREAWISLNFIIIIKLFCVVLLFISFPWTEGKTFQLMELFKYINANEHI